MVEMSGKQDTMSSWYRSHQSILHSVVVSVPSLCHPCASIVPFKRVGKLPEPVFVDESTAVQPAGFHVVIRV